MPSTHETASEHPEPRPSVPLGEQTANSIARLGSWLSDLAHEPTVQDDELLEGIRQVLRAHDPTTTTPDARRASGHVLRSLFQTIAHAFGMPSIDVPFPDTDDGVPPAPTPEPTTPLQETPPPRPQLDPIPPVAPLPRVETPQVLQEQPPAPSPLPQTDLPPPPPSTPLSRPEVRTTPDSSISMLPENVNLMGRDPITFRLDGADHTVSFSREGLTLDGRVYRLTALRVLLGADVPLNLIDVRRSGNVVLIKAGALGVEDTTDANDSELRLTLGNLIRNGTHTQRTLSGRTIRVGK